MNFDGLTARTRGIMPFGKKKGKTYEREPACWLGGDRRGY